MGMVGLDWTLEVSSNPVVLRCYLGTRYVGMVGLDWTLDDFSNPVVL